MYVPFQIISDNIYSIVHNIKVNNVGQESIQSTSSKMGRARVDWRKEGVTTSKTRGGTKEFRLYKCQAQPLPHDGKLPTYSQVSLAVSFELQNTESAFNMQEKTAVSSVAAQVIKSWAELTKIETTRQDNLTKIF